MEGTMVPGTIDSLYTGHDGTTYGGELDLDQEVWPLIEYMKTL
jgi:hypothetical protein